MAADASLQPPEAPVWNPWPHRLAILTAVATLLLILAGGLVTSLGAGLAVPDWPTTFGYNMFLYPWSRMVGGILYEHSHRLIGSVVGLLTVALALAIWVVDRRAWLRWLGGMALVGVILQGVLGGLRVVLVQETLAILHGILAQAFFGLLGSLVLFTSREWADPAAAARAADSGRVRWLADLTAGGIFLQIVAGALVTHLGARLDAHVGLAVLVSVLVVLMAIRVWREHADQGKLLRPVSILGGLLILQLFLGLGSYASRFTDLEVPLFPFFGLALPVTHRLAAALMLATSLVLVFRVHRTLRPSEAMADHGPVSRRVPA